MRPPAEQTSSYQKTLNLRELAQIAAGEEVAVGRVFDTTDELFQKTLKLLRAGGGGAREISFDKPVPEQRERYVPEHRDLRTLYLFAEALGGYERLHDLINQHSEGRRLSEDYTRRVKSSMLPPDELRALEHYYDQINDALRSAHQYLLSDAAARFDAAELRELFELLTTASKRSRQLTEILGRHLIHEVEAAVERLAGFRQMIQNVEHTVDGIFLVDSELLFVPTNELTGCVNTIFRAVGNPYVANHVDGVLLLAARNLLIQVASFHSYYGKHQIYHLIEKGGAGEGQRTVARRIRHEIRKLFEACKADNKLVLTRIIKDQERAFEISVEAIEAAAVERAVEEVKVFLPKEEPPPPPAPKAGLISRLLGWLRS